MGKENTLVKKTAIYAVGNMGSKILSYLMVLVYSYYIDTSDLGYYDLILTTVSMLQPLIMFELNDGVYRFLVDSNSDNQRKVLGSSFCFLCGSLFVSEMVFAGINNVYNFDYAFWIAAYLISIVLFTYFQETVRGLENSKLYATVGIINSFATLVIEIVLLTGFHMGVLSLLVSKVIAYGSCVLIILLRQKEVRKIMFYKPDKLVLKELLLYSVPLIPNAVCWWCVNSSDRYIILYFLGSSYNGVYSMANKFPTIITTVTSIFYLAWQDSAIKEYNSPSRDLFFSNIFKKYYTILFSLCLCAIPATKIVLELFLSESYKIAWEYTGFLYLAAVFSALCSFLGLGYQISKETKRSISTTFFSAGINVLINILLIRYIGLQAASFSTFTAYIFLFFIRIKHTKKYFSLDVNWKYFMLLLLACLLEIMASLIFRTNIVCVVLLIIDVVIGVALNMDLVMGSIRTLKGKLKKGI